MTTTVKVSAHCAQTKEVHIERGNGVVGDRTVIQDGETHECVVYDDYTVTVREVEKSLGQGDVSSGE